MFSNVHSIQLVVGALAAWRLTSLFVYEEGPFGIFERIRNIYGVYILDEDGMPSTFFGKLLSCMWCFSFWIGVMIAGISITKFWVFLIPFAYSAAAIIIHERLVHHG